MMFLHINNKYIMAIKEFEHTILALWCDFPLVDTHREQSVTPDTSN